MPLMSIRSASKHIIAPSLTQQGKRQKSVISFRFGQTPLKLSNPMYFRDKKLYEKKNLIFGLHYARQLDGASNGQYEWTDENGATYSNQVDIYPFDLIMPITQLKKGHYYKLSWEGAVIPYEAGKFSITIKSYADNSSTTFSAGELLEIEPEYTQNIPSGKARISISRNHEEPVDEGTQAGGKSSVSYIREYEILIID
jgi:hypothetical protein